jgi:hypothetical protein
MAHRALFVPRRLWLPRPVRLQQPQTIPLQSVGQQRVATVQHDDEVDATGVDDVHVRLAIGLQDHQSYVARRCQVHAGVALCGALVDGDALERSQLTHACDKLLKQGRWVEAVMQDSVECANEILGKAGLRRKVHAVASNESVIHAWSARTERRKRSKRTEGNVLIRKQQKTATTATQNLSTNAQSPAPRQGTENKQ